MTPLLTLPKLFLAGGAFLGVLQVPPTVPLDNHTLMGETIPAAHVVTRSMWGTPMLPDGKGGYSLIAPIRNDLIARSLWIPPVSGTRPTEKVPVTGSTNAIAKPATPAAPIVPTDTNAALLPAVIK